MSDLNTIVIRQITPADHSVFTAALELLNRTQGRDLFGPQYMDTKVNDPKALVLGAFDGNELVGVAVTQIIDNFEFYLPFDPQITSELKDKIVGSFSTLCVLERLQGKGIGKQMSQKRLEWLRQKKCEVVLGVSWVSGLKHTSDRVFESMGFRAVKKVSGFFVESSTKQPFDCPGCKQAPCQCAAILYRLELKASISTS